ncbi:hypothetical protein HYW55_02720 [Candidatus Gottesmanbacteria bacterium]|nr:hypothetical protein [Candidatus Gottesmanbacteria bacterium]
MGILSDLLQSLKPSKSASELTNAHNWQKEIISKTQKKTLNLHHTFHSHHHSAHHIQ